MLEDKAGNRILFDPGSFSFADGSLKPEDIGSVDVVFITHSHADHYYPEALRFFAASGCERIIASADICELLKKEGLPFETIRAGEEKEAGGFKIKAIEASHGPLPIPIPHNFAFLVNDIFLHAGDSTEVALPAGIKVEVLALPTFAPWEKTIESLEFAKRIRPRTAIPIHDWFIKDMPLERFYALMYKPVLEKEGVEFKQLALGESLEI